MSVQDTLDLFGNNIGITYLDSAGVYHSVSAYYTQSTSEIGLARDWNDTTGYTIAGRSFLTYQFETEGTLNSEPRNITVDLNCQYSIFNTEYIYTCAAMPCSTQTNITAYNSPVWSWVWSGHEVQFSPSDIAVNNLLPQIYFTQDCDFIPAYMNSQAVTSGYSLRVVFDHASLSNGRYGRFYLGIPYVSEGASGYNGTSGLTTTILETTTTAINVNVDVDLEQTNGLLGSIITAVGNVASSIITGIQNLFVPTSAQLDDFLDNLEQLLYSKVAPLYDAVSQINRVFTSIRDNGTDTVVYVPPVTISHGNDSMTLDFNDDLLGGIPLYYDVGGNTASSNLLLAAKKAVDIVCTLAFINMCRRKLDLILNPESETFIEGGTDS